MRKSIVASMTIHWSICAQVVPGQACRRLSNGALATTSTECGRCEYPLLQAEQKTFEDSEFICCDMCGATFDVEDGAPQPSAEGAGKPLFGALLKAKPQKSLLVFENRELKDGGVYVNITPKSKQLFEDEEPSMLSQSYHTRLLYHSLPPPVRPRVEAAAPQQVRVPAIRHGRERRRVVARGRLRRRLRWW